MIYFALGVVIVLMTGLSQYVLRSSVECQGWQKYRRIASAYGIYFALLFVNILFLQNVELKYMSVVMASSYVLAYFIGVYCFDESTSNNKRIGIGFIFIGSVIFMI